MSWEKCVTVNLNSDSTGSFYTGDIVTGTVILDLEKDIQIDNVDLEIVGISKVQWTRPSPTVPYIKNYSEKKKILYIKTSNIFGNFLHGNHIRAGVYSYPFHFSLPEDLPSSFRGALGKVFYSLKIKSQPKFKIKKTVPFYVLGKVDVNNFNNVDELLTPFLYEFSKTIRSFGGKVTVHLKTYKAVGLRQTIPFDITINNEKKVKISQIKIALMQKLRYTASSGYADEEKKLCNLTYKNVGKSTSEFCNMKMEIPQTVPSSLNLAKDNNMIDISYIFRVQICFPFHINLYEDIPVMITTVPVLFYDF